MAFTTRPEILDGVRKNDDDCWRSFQEFYAPLIALCGKKLVLSNEELQDLEQEVLLAIFRGKVVDHYHPEKGMFRAYLLAVIRRKAYRILKKREKHTLPLGEEVEEMETEGEVEALWEAEWQEFVLQVALSRLKQVVEDTTYMAFELSAIHHTAPKKVAEILQISENQVYQARSRCQARLVEIVQQLKQNEK